MQKAQNVALLATVIALLSVCNLWAAAPGGVKGYALWGQPQSQNIESGKGVSLFCVQQPDSANEAVYWKISGDSLQDILMTNKRKANLNDCEYINFGSIDPNQQQISTYNNGRMTGKNLKLEFAKGNASVPVEKTGISDEVVLYNRVLNSVERLKVETYLALNHDITLQNNYIASDKQLVWNRTSLEAYSHHISGIARDDSSALKKDTLKTTALVFRSNRPLDNHDFVLVGDNNGKLRFGSDTTEVSLDREWVASVTCDTMSVDITLDDDQIEEMLDKEVVKSFRLKVDSVSYTADEEGVFRNVLLNKGVNSIAVTADGKKLVRTTGEGMFKEMQVYPNPTTDGNVRIRIQMPEESGLVVRLYAPNGNFIGQSNDTKDQYHDININLPYSGVFMVQLHTLKETKTISLIRK